MLQKKKNLLILNIIMTNNDKLFAFVFPGQGSQIVGMGKNLYKQHRIARDTFDEVDEVLKFNLRNLIFEGPENLLTLTVNTQPALMTVSIALSRVLEYELKKSIHDIAYVVCGHSLGEYSALCSINCISLADTAKLLKIRGKSMQEAVRNEKTQMTAIIGMNVEEIEKIIMEIDCEKICDIANDNCPGQVVISGHREIVEKVAVKCKSSGAKTTVDLNVSAPFHSSLMKSSARVMAKELKDVKISELKTNFIPNVTASYETDSSNIKNLLESQITKRVRWRESINLIYNSNIRKIVEVGSKKVLSGLNKRMGLNLESFDISDLPGIENFLEANFKI